MSAKNKKVPENVNKLEFIFIFSTQVIVVLND